MKTQINKITRPLSRMAQTVALALAAIGGVFAVHAAVLNYGYVSLSSIQTTPEVVWPAAVGTTLRLTHYDVTSDTNTATLKIMGGTAQYALQGTNAITATNFTVLSNVGLSSNDIVVIQLTDNTTYSATVWGTNNTTNVSLTATLATNQTSGAILYRMGMIHTNSLSGVGGTWTTNLAKSGTALFAPQTKMPMLLRLTPGLTKASINSATAVYDLQ